jgi:hypothetical protein
MPTYGWGWDVDHYQEQHARLTAAGEFSRVLTFAPSEIPESWCLLQYRDWDLEQGQAGTCWVHSGVQNTHVTSRAQGYEIFQVCRNLVGWEGKQLEGGGAPGNGGTATDALLAQTQSKGVGFAHEDLYPYSDVLNNRSVKPPMAVFEDAKKSHLLAVVDVKGPDERRRMISQGYGVSNGVWWPNSWDSSQAIMDKIGPGGYGHALLIMGYVQPGVWHPTKGAWMMDNWHGAELYPVLEDRFASKLNDYRPDGDHCSHFWVWDDVYQAVCDKGNAEHVAITGVEGLDRNIVSRPTWMKGFI